MLLSAMRPYGRKSDVRTTSSYNTHNLFGSSVAKHFVYLRWASLLSPDMLLHSKPATNTSMSVPTF